MVYTKMARIKINTTLSKLFLAGVSIMVLVTLGVACRESPRENGLVIEYGTPPRFAVSGPSTLEHFQVSGPDLEREPNRHGDGKRLMLGKVYWEIVPSGATTRQDLDEIGRIEYGKPPDGFIQIYPTNGVPPPLVEEDLYNVTLKANSGRGVNMFFFIRSGKIVPEEEK